MLEGLLVVDCTHIILGLPNDLKFLEEYLKED